MLEKGSNGVPWSIQLESWQRRCSNCISKIFIELFFSVKRAVMIKVEGKTGEEGLFGNNTQEREQNEDKRTDRHCEILMFLKYFS